MLRPGLAFLPAAVAVMVSAPAQAMVYLSVDQAQKQLFGDEALTPVPLSLTPEQAAAIEKDSGVHVYSPTLSLWRAADGWLLIDAVIGKHDLIPYALALDSAGKVRGMEILEYRESYGGEVRNPRWRAQFTGKHHGDEVQVGDDIQGISGATLSCQHLSDGVRRLLATYAIAISKLPPATP
jgi:hypothetical protein